MPFKITDPVIIITIILAVAFGIFVTYAIIQGQRRKPSVGVEKMIGKKAVVQTALNPKGTVLAEGERWTAIADSSTIEAGEEVTITNVEGLTLWVTQKSNDKETR